MAEATQALPADSSDMAITTRRDGQSRKDTSRRLEEGRSWSGPLVVTKMAALLGPTLHKNGMGVLEAHFSFTLQRRQHQFCIFHRIQLPYGDAPTRQESHQTQGCSETRLRNAQITVISHLENRYIKEVQEFQESPPAVHARLRPLQPSIYFGESVRIFLRRLDVDEKESPLPEKRTDVEQPQPQGSPFLSRPVFPPLPRCCLVLLTQTSFVFVSNFVAQSLLSSTPPPPLQPQCFSAGRRQVTRLQAPLLFGFRIV